MPRYRPYIGATALKLGQYGAPGEEGDVGAGISGYRPMIGNTKLDLGSMGSMGGGMGGMGSMLGGMGGGSGGSSTIPMSGSIVGTPGAETVTSYGTDAAGNATSSVTERPTMNYINKMGGWGEFMQGRPAQRANNAVQQQQYQSQMDLYNRGQNWDQQLNYIPKFSETQAKATALGQNTYDIENYKAAMDPANSNVAAIQSRLAQTQLELAQLKMQLGLYNTDIPRSSAIAGLEEQGVKNDLMRAQTGLAGAQTSNVGADTRMSNATLPSRIRNLDLNSDLTSKQVNDYDTMQNAQREHMFNQNAVLRAQAAGTGGFERSSGMQNGWMNLGSGSAFSPGSGTYITPNIGPAYFEEGKDFMGNPTRKPSGQERIGTQVFKVPGVGTNAAPGSVGQGIPQQGQQQGMVLNDQQFQMLLKTVQQLLQQQKGAK